MAGTVDQQRVGDEFSAGMFSDFEHVAVERREAVERVGRVFNRPVFNRPYAGVVCVSVRSSRCRALPSSNETSNRMAKGVTRIPHSRVGAEG